MKKRVLAVVMCALMAGTAFTGFKDAGDDKELVLFTWEGMFPQEVLDDFEKETGVKVVYSNFDTDETMLEKLSMAKGLEKVKEGGVRCFKCYELRLRETAEIAKQIEADVPVLAITNLLDKAEIEEKIRPYLNK